MTELSRGIIFKNCTCSDICEICLKGKMQRIPFPKQSERKTNAVMDIVHTDICGPMRNATLGGKRYLLTFIDDYSRYTVIYMLHKNPR